MDFMYRSSDLFLSKAPNTSCKSSRRIFYEKGIFRLLAARGTAKVSI
jgi:hypothetical protein